MRSTGEANAVLAWCAKHQAESVALIKEMVERESPSDNPEPLRKWADWFEGVALQFGGTMERTRDGHLICRFSLSGCREEAAQLLALGHYDTVWSLGTLATVPFREADGRLWGPGVLDMKTGIAMLLMAVRALLELNVDVAAPVVLQLNADEETGSETSRSLTEQNALASRAVLVLEPGTGWTGKLKTARKGIGGYRVVVHGRASHSGVDFEAGASAVLELARQVLRIAEFSDVANGVTVNPGVIAGGTRSNVIPAEAWTDVDFRVPTLAAFEILDQRFRSLYPIDVRCTLQVEGGLNRPPMERSEAIGGLFQIARKLATSIHVDLEESSTGGGSDGNFTAALGVPTLDGLGAVGEGAHAVNESVFTERIADRTALLALLLAELGSVK